MARFTQDDAMRILTLASECRAIAGKIERQFGKASTSRHEMWRAASLLLGQANRLKNDIDAWFDTMRLDAYKEANERHPLPISGKADIPAVDMED